MPVTNLHGKFLSFLLEFKNTIRLQFIYLTKSNPASQVRKPLSEREVGLADTSEEAQSWDVRRTWFLRLMWDSGSIWLVSQAKRCV